VSAAARFDEIVHAPNRLQICAILSAVSSADFATVRESLGVADSVLSKHVRVLHEAGYVDVHKSGRAPRVRTSLSLTIAGRAAYDGHVAALRAIVSNEGLPADGPARRSLARPGAEGPKPSEISQNGSQCLTVVGDELIERAGSPASQIGHG
jgi:DNA-binding MarR family transcriptional regulator